MNTSVRRLAALLLVPLLAACSAAPATAPSASPTTSLTVGLGYIPSVQFAPFYYAQAKGYYAAAGLKVTFQNKVDPDLISLVGQGTIDIGLADGTSVIPAVSQGIPVRYVTTIYAKFPDIVFAKASSGIAGAADLKGKKIGTPGKYGSGWIMLLALLSSAHLTASDVDVQLYPDYGQAGALSQGAIAAATGFLNNEPVQLGLAGTKTTVLTVDSIVPLPGNGLVAGVTTIRDKAAALKAFIAITLRSMKEIAADPDAGVDATLAQVPELATTDRATQRAILDATIAMWTDAYTTAHGMGAIDPSAWQASAAFMVGLKDGTLASAPPVDEMVDDSLLAP